MKFMNENGSQEKIIHHFTIVHKKKENIRLKFVLALPHAYNTPLS